MIKHYKIYLTALFCIMAMPQAVFAQKGFESKRKSPIVQNRPSFSYDRITISDLPGNARMGFGNVFSGNGVRAKLDGIKVVRDTGGRVVWLENAKTTRAGLLPNGRVNASLAASNFLREVQHYMQIPNPDDSFEITKVDIDEKNQTHIRLKQVYKNIPVYGGEIVLHSVGDTLRLLNGRYFPNPKLNSVIPGLGKERAEQFALADLSARTIVRNPSDALAGRFCKSSHELVIYYREDFPNDPRLAWHVTVHPNLIERWEYFVDAGTGVVLDKYNHTCGVDGPVTSSARDLNNIQRNFSTYQVGSSLYMIDASKPMFKNNKASIPGDPQGVIWTIDAGNTTGEDLKVRHITSNSSTSWNATAVSAHLNAGLAYDYFRNTFKRNSLNGKDGTVISIINIADEEDGKGMDNAFWNGEFMGYGNGRNSFKPLAGGLDVAGHEMTHGVIQNTANLEYQGQSGAINESMADVFGVLIDRDDWTLGEDVVKTSAFPSGALRSMSNPNQGGQGQRGYQPKTMAQFVKTNEDNGGVHINSGIPNFAFYQIASKISREKAEQIYYRALTQYLTRRSQFLDLRLAIVQSATDLYGSGSTETKVASDAFDAVGITSGTTTQAPDPTNLPVNTGADGILVVGTNDGAIYQTTPQLANFTSRSTKGTGHKPSVTDDGQLAYFVSDDGRIRAISLSGSAQEQIVSNETIWDNVAISRDGKKLAALTSDKNNKVYVYSFDLKKWSEFSLYNPTYSEGVSTGEVQYADAIVWDISGEYLVYDANNQLKSLDGKSHEYWDVGFLRAWNNASGNFGNGSIEKLFTNLDEGENIGNPAFSKNSPNIISFDYYYEPDEIYSLIGVDVDNGTVNEIYRNNSLGFPDYSRKDDQMIFSTEAGSAENVGIINLAPDRISASGNATTLMKNGKLAVWYGQGTRQTARQAQSIQFNQPSDRVIGDAGFDLSATSSAGLTVTFEKVSGGITVQGKQVTLNKAGKATVRASQAGNDKFEVASTVDRTFCINPTRPSVVRNGVNYTATSTGGSDFIWFSDGVEVLRDPSGAVIIEQAGNYEVRATTTDGCISAAFQIITNAVLGTEPVAMATGAPYPNPVADQISLEADWGRLPSAISFTDVSGRTTTVTGRLNGRMLLIPAQQLLPGIYILNVQATAKEPLRYKIVKQ
ncbi:M4 family metallopeptidase [Dyadobacter sp. 32]|uniref:M4 family metallopeptidase n=1 Tax=Dyadobacter sp. 32 TaxID=538966 RepID=UPI0011ECCC1E